MIRSSDFATDGSMGRRKMPGATPMSTAIATVGIMSAHSRGERSGSRAFFSFVISP